MMAYRWNAGGVESKEALDSANQEVLDRLNEARNVLIRSLAARLLQHSLVELNLLTLAGATVRATLTAFTCTGSVSLDVGGIGMESDEHVTLSALM